MECALIVSRTEKSIAILSDMLSTSLYDKITITASCGEARRMLIEKDFDLVIVNMPLLDESGESLARDITAMGAGQVILIVKSEHFDEVSAVCESEGVLTVAKPLNTSVFWAVLKLAKATQNRMRRLYAENSKLTQRIEDIRIVNRAKCVLVSYMKITEQEAHRFIEKQAMDRRISKRAIAEGILRTYEG